MPCIGEFARVNILCIGETNKRLVYKTLDLGVKPVPSTTSHRTQPKNRRDESNRRVEVSLTVDSTGERQVLLRDMSFGNGIGWYTEKSVRLDSKQVEALLRSLCACRQHPSTVPAAAASSPTQPDCGAVKDGGDTKILTFPSILPRS